MITLRMVLAIAASRGWTVHQLDVETAFLNADVSETIYVKKPDGSYIRGPNMVLKLKKSLFGLKQAPFYWNKLLTDHLKSLGLKQSADDPRLFIHHNTHGEVSLLTVYVDDILVVSIRHEQLDRKRKALRITFKVNDVGEANQLLGMEISSR